MPILLCAKHRTRDLGLNTPQATLTSLRFALLDNNRGNVQISWFVDLSEYACHEDISMAEPTSLRSSTLSPLHLNTHAKMPTIEILSCIPTDQVHNSCSRYFPTDTAAVAGYNTCEVCSRRRNTTTLSSRVVCCGSVDMCCMATDLATIVSCCASTSSCHSDATLLLPYRPSRQTSMAVPLCLLSLRLLYKPTHRTYPLL
jgi:hypothetical protein